MHLRRFAVSALILIPAFFFAIEQAKAADDSVVIVYKNGHRQTLTSTQIARIDLKAATIAYKDGHQEKIDGAIERIEFGEIHQAALPGRAHYIGKWEVGDGAGHKFNIILDSDGDAKKTIGSTHGTWTLVDGEAHIAWDDGWHDIIRKKGSTHEKVAFEPGKGFDGPPSNVAEARNIEKKSI